MPTASQPLTTTGRCPGKTRVAVSADWGYKVDRAPDSGLMAEAADTQLYLAEEIVPN